MNMEAKLAAYRQRKTKEKQSENSVINRLKVFLTKGKKEAPKSSPQLDDKGNGVYDNSESETETSLPVRKRSQAAIQTKQKTTNKGGKNMMDCNLSHNDFNEQSTEMSTITVWALRILKLSLWLCLWGLFIELQFGAVFFSISLIVFVYFNTRTGPRDNKPSAYSVFNKDCERIEGTLTAEQLEKQMFRVPGL